MVVAAGGDVWYNVGMGLVKTRRLAYPHPALSSLRDSLRSGDILAGADDPWGSRQAERCECRAMQKQQRAKAAMKPPMKGGAGKGVPRQFAAAPKSPLRVF